MKLSNEQYEYVKSEAVDLFTRYGVRCIPISGFELAMQMGITLVPYSWLNSEKLAAAMQMSEDGFRHDNYLSGREYILFNDLKGYERSNMTVLHEVSHGVLGHHDGMNDDLAEAEASFFAKYAIAPPPLVHRIRPTCPEDIEEFFYISKEAAQNAYEYYRKWLRKYNYRNGVYLPYERKLIELFPNIERKGVLITI